jgi:cell division septation protein DedD
VLDTKPARDTPTPQPYDSRAVSTPEAGASYLQVTALPRADADGVVKTLRDQSFPTILAASSKDGLFRVLVGPYHQTSQLADAKARLKAIGFGSAFVQKQ